MTGCSDAFTALATAEAVDRTRSGPTEEGA